MLISDIKAIILIRSNNPRLPNTNFTLVRIDSIQPYNPETFVKAKHFRTSGTSGDDRLTLHPGFIPAVEEVGQGEEGG